MADEPQEPEVGIELTVENRLEIELYVRLTGEGVVVPKDAQHEPIGHEGPQ